MLQTPETYLVHMAGPVLHAQSGPVLILRQRCAWCGTILVDDSLPVSNGYRFTFDIQSQVAVANGCAWPVQRPLMDLAPQSCLYLDPYVTR